MTHVTIDSNPLDVFFIQYVFAIINFILLLTLILVILISLKLVLLHMKRNHLDQEILVEKKRDEEKEDLWEMTWLPETATSKTSKRLRFIDQFTTKRELTHRNKQEDSIDVLTGCIGRKSFKDLISPSGSLIYCNVNGLRKVNKEKGFLEGDRQLVLVSEIMKRNLPPETALCRINGDEFAADLPLMAKSMAEALISKINKEIAMQKEAYVDLAVGVIDKRELENKEAEYVLTKAEEDMQKNKLISKNSRRSQLIFSLLHALGEKSFETEEHALRLRDHAYEVGKRMRLSPSEMNDIILLAYLHDIGKMSIPDAILTKPTKLSSIEWETMKRHPKLGADFVGRIPDLSSAATGILYHHENWDGSGYPEGLSETNIPLVARIIRVVDSFDAMTNTRSYNRIKTKTEALNEIINYSGVHYDPEVVDVFSEIIRNEIEENRKTQSKNTEEKQHKIVRLY